MTTNFTGGCLCEAVRYESSEAPSISAHCQCIDCRKSSGSGHCTHLVLAKNVVSVTGKIATYDRPADSGNVVTRVFCPSCGAPIYSLNSAMPGNIFIRASSLDDPEVCKPSMLVYASRGPSWDSIDPALPAFAEMPEQIPDEVGLV